LERFINAFIDFPKPLIAAVNGPAIGVGATFTALCDFVYASEKATFHTPFLSLAQTAEACSSYTFPKAMGPRFAYEVLVLGRKLNASEAKQHGLINDVFSSSDFQKQVHAIATQLAAEPLLTLLATKRVCHLTSLLQSFIDNVVGPQTNKRGCCFTRDKQARVRRTSRTMEIARVDGSCPEVYDASSHVTILLNVNLCHLIWS